MKRSGTLKFLGFGLILFGISCNPQPGGQKTAANRNADSANVDTANVCIAAAPSRFSSDFRVLFPGEGEKLIKGETYMLKWKGGEEEISIFLVDSSLESTGVSVSISDRVYGIANTGAYEYKVPENLEEGTYKFNIGKASSPYFEISSR